MEKPTPYSQTYANYETSTYNFIFFKDSYPRCSYFGVRVQRRVGRQELAGV